MELCCERVVLRLEPQHDRLKVCDPASEPLVLVEEARVASDIPKESLGHREKSSAHLVGMVRNGAPQGIIKRHRCWFQGDTTGPFGQLRTAVRDNGDMASPARSVRPIAVWPCQSICRWNPTGEVWLDAASAALRVFRCEGCGSEWVRTEAWTPVDVDGHIPPSVAAEHEMDGDAR